MTKTIYQSPWTRVLEESLQEGILFGSVEAMQTVNGSWEEEDE